MSLNQTVKKEVTESFEKYEGRIPYLYLDTAGKVTVGVGCMVPNSAAMANVVMYKKGTDNTLKLASQSEKQTEYETIKKRPFGMSYAASAFKDYGTLTMKDVDINTLRDRQMQSFYKDLTNYYKVSNGFSTEFDSMPVEVQKALFDMVFNLGITKFKNQYVKFNSSIKAEKWADAAKQSNRIGISPSRNRYVFGLLKTADGKKIKES